jgi:hypothetical protein
MKKILLLLLLAGCTVEETVVIQAAEEEVCECYKETWIKHFNTDWQYNNEKVYYSDDCTDHGDELLGYVAPMFRVRYRINCY